MASIEMDDLVSDFSRFYILTILYEGPTHGYGILRKFQSRVGKKISPGLVYPFLQRLEEKGIVDHTIEMVGEKERKIHYLTEEGRTLSNRLFKRFAHLVSVAIEPSLEVCAHCACKIYEGGHKEIIDGEETVFCCSHCAASFKREMGSE
jgi:DNA-binding PadR family transcriptional regulator